MSRRIGWVLSAALALVGSSGCGLLCDRYCERHDRCDRYRQDRCGYANPPPPNNCCPPTGVYTAQPAPYCP